MCECENNPKNCKHPGDCFHYDDYLYSLPSKENDEEHISVGDDGICRSYPGASFWYD